MVANPINPVEYGGVVAKVQHMEESIKKMETTIATMAGQIDALTEILNKGKGAFWAAFIIGSAISSVITFLFAKAPLIQGMFK